MKISPRFFAHLSVTILIFSLILFSQSCQRNQPEPSVPSEQLILNITKTNSSSLLFLAKDNGYFEEQSLNVIFNEFQSGKEALKSFLAGEAALSTCAEFAFVSQSFTNPELKILAAFSTLKNKEIISRKDSSILTPQDMIGKRVGVTRKSGGEYLLGIFLQSHGLEMNDVVIFDLKPENIVEGLLTGKIDLGVTWEPYVYNLRKLLGDNFKSWPIKDKNDTFALLIANDDWLTKNPEKAERFLKAILKAEKLTKTKPDTIRNHLAKSFLYEDEYIDSIIANTKFHLELPKELPGVMAREARWRIDQGLTRNTQVPDYLKSFYFAGMEAVKKDAVNIDR